MNKDVSDMGVLEFVIFALLFIAIFAGITYLIGVIIAVLTNYVLGQALLTYTQGWAVYLLLIIAGSTFKANINVRGS